MSDDTSNVNDVVQAIEGVAKAVPIYQDLLQPAVQEVGKGLATVAKTVHVALAPVSALVWGYDQIKEFVSTKVTERLKNVPPEDIVPPEAYIAGPALEALKYTGHSDELSDLYANLLASSMDKSTKAGTHPAFVDVIRQLTPDEAKLLSHMGLGKIGLPVIDIIQRVKGGQGTRIWYQNFSLLGHDAGCELPEMTPTYLTNIGRLGLASVIDFIYSDDSYYERLINAPEVQDIKTAIERDDQLVADYSRKSVRITPFGIQFYTTCVQRKG